MWKPSFGTASSFSGLRTAQTAHRPAAGHRRRLAGGASSGRMAGMPLPAQPPWRRSAALIAIGKGPCHVGPPSIQNVAAERRLSRTSGGYRAMAPAQFATAAAQRCGAAQRPWAPGGAVFRRSRRAPLYRMGWDPASGPDRSAAARRRLMRTTEGRTMFAGPRSRLCR